jgi:hypothetical protein
MTTSSYAIVGIGGRHRMSRRAMTEKPMLSPKIASCGLRINAQAHGRF